MTPVVRMNGSAVNSTIIEFGPKMVVGTDIVDSLSLTKSKLDDILNPPSTDVFTGCPVSSHIALANSVVGRGYTNTYDYNPNGHEYCASMLYISEREQYISTFNFSSWRKVIYDADGKYVTSSRDDSYLQMKCFVDIGSKLLEFGANSYYDRAVAFNTYNKSDLSRISTDKLTFNYGYIALMEFDETTNNAIIFAHDGSGNIYSGRYDIQANSVTWLLQQSMGIKEQPGLSPYLPWSTDTEKYFFYAFPNADSNLTLRLIKFDKSAYTMSQVQEFVTDISWPKYNDQRALTRIFITPYPDDNTKCYVHVLFATRHDYQQNIQYPLVTFLADNSPSLTNVGQFVLPLKATSFLPLNQTFDLQIFVSDTQLVTGTFANEQWTFDAIPFSETINFVLRDSIGRVWVRATSGSIYMFAPNVPVDIKIRPEKQYYDYAGTNINANIYVSAVNFKQQLIQVPVKLNILSSNAEFSDGTKSKIVTTSATDEVQVPIVITGPGDIFIIGEYNG